MTDQDSYAWPSPFRVWARHTFGAEQGDRLSDEYADAVGRTLDTTVFHGTQPIQETQMDEPLPPELAHLNEAERLGLVVGAAYGQALAERDQARNIAATLEQQLAKALETIRYALKNWPETTWATDSLVQENVKAWLEALESPETPETSKGTR